jgi:hypothetical protein
MQSRKPVQRLVRMVGPPPDLPEVSPTIAAVAVMEPPAPVPGPRLVGLPMDKPEDVPKKSKAALRAERWREKQKTKDSGFGKKEAKRKADEREEEDRRAQIAGIVADSKANPDGPMLTVVDADGNRVRVISGGFGSRRVADTDDKAEQIEESDGTRRVTAAGAAPANYDADAEKHARREHETQFVLKAFQYVRTPREVKAMKQFIYSNVERYSHKSELTVCSHCKSELTPFPSEVPFRAFHHFHDAHPALFQTMMAKVKKAGEKQACPEDHDGMIKRYAGDGMKVQCRRCRKILWRPGERRRKRSDTLAQPQEPANAA